MSSSTPTPQPAVYATVSALDGGHISLRDALYFADADPNSHTTVPSLSFLIQHPSPSGTPTNILFDLGLKRNISDYPPGFRDAIAAEAARGALQTHPDCSASLRHGANATTGQPDLLTPEKDIHYIILSHVHWDHTGTPSDFPRATFVVGSGSLHLLRHGAAPYNPADEFNADELPLSRTVELPPAPVPACSGTEDFDAYYAGPQAPQATRTSLHALPNADAAATWRPFAGFPATIDFFGDGSVRIVDCPGHIYGHINLLVRVARDRWVYLGGDCCHDGRMLRGARDMAEYVDGRGVLRSAHVHTGLAKESLRRIREGVRSLACGEGEGAGEGVDVEFVIAHDREWRERNRDCFWPGTF